MKTRRSRQPKKKQKEDWGGGGGAAYVRIRQTTVVMHDLRTQKVPKRGEAEFKDIFASALKLVRVIQTLVELKRFFGPERSAQRKEHVRILKRAQEGEAAVSARLWVEGGGRGELGGGGLTVPAPLISLVRTKILR